MSDVYMEWSLSYICWDHTQLRHCCFIVWQDLGYLNGRPTCTKSPFGGPWPKVSAERHKDYKPRPAESLTEMFDNKDLRSHSNFKLLLSTQVINMIVIITPINWVTKMAKKEIYVKQAGYVTYWLLRDWKWHHWKWTSTGVRIFSQSTHKCLHKMCSILIQTFNMVAKCNLWPYESDTADKRNNSVWYDINWKCIYVDVWICWWCLGIPSK